jgi:hypothetical protein
MQPKFSRYYTYVKPLTRNKFVRSYATTIFNMIAISIFAFYAIRPTVVTILALHKSLSEQKTILENVVSKRNSLAQGKANFEGLVGVDGDDDRDDAAALVLGRRVVRRVPRSGPRPRDARHGAAVCLAPLARRWSPCAASAKA